MSDSCSVMRDSLRPHGPWQARLFCPQGAPGKNTGVGCHALLHSLTITPNNFPGFLAYPRDLLQTHISLWIIPRLYVLLNSHIVTLKILYTNIFQIEIQKINFLDVDFLDAFLIECIMLRNRKSFIKPLSIMNIHPYQHFQLGMSWVSI